MINQSELTHTGARNTELSAPSTTSPGIYNPETFSQMMQISRMMAHSSLIPESLKGRMVKGQIAERYPIEVVEANCLLIVEQSHRWGMSPFAVAQYASVVHGRLMWEGKFVHAVLSRELGINLNYDYTGQGDSMQVTVSGTLPGEANPRTVTGTVGAWKTSQWGAAAHYEQRLAYRGAREWGRRHAPDAMMGVMADDEELPAPAPMRDVSQAAEATAPAFVQDTAPALPAAKQEERIPLKQDETTSPAPAAEAKGETYPVMINSVESRVTPKGKDFWNVHFAGGDKSYTASTFSESMSAKAHTLTGAQSMVTVQRKESNGRVYLNLLGVEPIVEEAKGPF